jgi:hypothetical protein
MGNPFRGRFRRCRGITGREAFVAASCSEAGCAGRCLRLCDRFCFLPGVVRGRESQLWLRFGGGVRRKVPVRVAPGGFDARAVYGCGSVAVSRRDVRCRRCCTSGCFACGLVLCRCFCAGQCCGAVPRTGCPGRVNDGSPITARWQRYDSPGDFGAPVPYRRAAAWVAAPGWAAGCHLARTELHDVVTARNGQHPTAEASCGNAMVKNLSNDSRIKKYFYPCGFGE